MQHLFFQMCATLRCPRRRQFRSVGVQVSESEFPRCEQDTAFVRFRSHSLHGGAERLERARSAGEFARQKLEGTRSCVPPTPPLSRSCQHIQNRLYVIVRGWCGEHGFTYSWSTASRILGIRGNLPPPPEVIYHGFPSLVEAQEYWRSAGFTHPLLEL